jgi:hypothetical protein
MNPINTNHNQILEVAQAERNETNAVVTNNSLNPLLADTEVLSRATTSTEVKNYFVETISATEFNKKLKDIGLAMPFVKVEGYLSYKNDSIWLPNIIQASSINISNFNNKYRLPLRSITDSIKFSSCNIDDIGIIKTKSLSLYNMQELTKIYNGSNITDELYIEDCPNLLNFPQDFSVKKLTMLWYQPNKLTTLNIKIHNGGSLAVALCKNIALQEIPESLKDVTLKNVNKEIVNQLNATTITNNLDISLCSEVTTLPSNLKVNGNLKLSYCRNFTNFPADIIVEGDIEIFHCPELQDIPEEWIQNLPYDLDNPPINIILTETSISIEQINRYNQLANGRAIFIDGRPKKIKLASLEEAIDFWYKKSENNHKPDIGVLNDQQKQDIFLFLNELTTSASYNKNNNTAIVLAKQLMQILSMLADDNIELKERALAQFSEANSSCVDRTTLYLSKLQILNCIVDAEKASRINDFTGEKLRTAAKYCFYMEDIELYAIQKSNSNKSIEDIEFFLEFLIRLAHIFNLPITTVEANHTVIANLTTSDIKQAKKIIEEKITAEFENRLAEWTPWQQHQRFQNIKDKKYTSLPIIANSKTQQHECSISSKTNFDDAVVYGNNIYSYHELTRWYVQQGTDPFTNTPIDLSKIYRIETQGTSKNH